MKSQNFQVRFKLSSPHEETPTIANLGPSVCQNIPAYLFLTQAWSSRASTRAKSHRLLPMALLPQDYSPCGADSPHQDSA